MTAAQRSRVVGLIGGMGPAATVDLMQRVVARCAAGDDQDHVHLIVDQNPKVPSRVEHLIAGTGEDPTAALVRSACRLRDAGAEALAIACNTAHHYAPAVRTAVALPLLDMIALTAAAAARLAPGGRIGVAASTAVHRTALYELALAQVGCTTVIPQDQDALMGVIAQVKRGEVTSVPAHRFAGLAASLAADCDVLVVACTELSVIAGTVRVAVPVLDAADVLADAIIDFAGARRRRAAD